MSVEIDSTLVESTAPKQSDREIVQIPLLEIYVDSEFNCRGKIKPYECMELAQSIRERGLLSPIQVQKLSTPGPRGEKYGIISGHRRYIAHRLNNAETIDAEILEDISPYDAAVINLKENIDRVELNPVQEGRGIQSMRAYRSLTTKEIATELNRSEEWVKVRIGVMELEGAIQEEVEKGILTVKHIRQLMDLPAGKRRYDFVKQIKEARYRGETPRVSLAKKTPFAKKARDRTEIFEMQDHIVEALADGDPTQIPFEAQLILQALGWVAGEVTDMDIFDTLRQLAKKYGRRYEIPKVYVQALQS